MSAGEVRSTAASAADAVASDSVDAGATLLNPEAAAALLSSYEIRSPSQTVLNGAQESDVISAVDSYGVPLVLKAYGQSIHHKSELGAVRVIRSRHEAGLAAGEMLATVPGLEGFLVQEYVDGTTELLLGLRRDPVLGAFVVVGLGGLMVEIYRDFSVRPVPLTRQACRQMLAELRAAIVLDGYRGGHSVDRERIVDYMMALSELAQRRPEVWGVDLNPVKADTDGLLWAVDSRVFLRDHLAAPSDGPADDIPGNSLEALLRPASIAVIGATPDPAKPGFRLVNYLVGNEFPGRIYPVNRRGREVAGLTSLQTLQDLPEVPDLACLCIPAEQVPGVLEECADMGIPAALVYSSGFAESGSDGERLQQEVALIARRTGMRIAGPNTAGIVNLTSGMCAAIGMAFEQPVLRGGVAVITQSGAIGGALVSRLSQSGVGISYWITCGNEVDVDAGEYLLNVVADPGTRMVVLFLEGIRNAETFSAACKLARSLGKPVLVYKVGSSELGRRAVASHTAGLAGDDVLHEAIFRDVGAIRVRELRDLVDVTMAMAWQPLPQGSGVGVVSTSGGACGVIADLCSSSSLTLPRLKQATEEAIREVIPPYGNSQNPVDVTMTITARPDMISAVVKVLQSEESVHTVLVMLTTNAGTGAVRIADDLAGLARQLEKPLIVVRMGDESLSSEAVARYRQAHIPLYSMPEPAVRVIESMAKISASLSQREKE